MPEDHFRDDQELRSQLVTLDQSPRARRGLGRSTIMSVVRQTPVGPLSPWIVSLVVAVLLGVTLYVGWLVRQNMRESVRASLQTVLAANINALELWLTDQRDTASQYVADQELRRFAIQTLQAAGDPKPSPMSDEQRSAAATSDGVPSDSEHFNRLTNRLAEAGYEGWAIVDPLGRILESNAGVFNGVTIPLDHRLLDRLSSGRAAVTRPFAIDLTDNEISGGRKLPRAVMCAIAPLRNDLDTLGSLALMIDPSRQFSKILSVAQMGDSGETYAFDRQGLMLSRSRFESQLTRAGLLAVGQASPLQIQIRDPQFDIRESDLRSSNQNSDQHSSGDSNESDPHAQPGSRRTDPQRYQPLAWPLTLMADSATRGGDGFNVVGYNDYRGVPVVGAWKWLTEYDFGVATELDVDEAFGSLRILRNSFVALLGSVLIAAVILIGLAWITRPRDRESGRVQDLNRRLGQYDLQQRIGRGGMGTVYLGEHGLLDRKVAIKVLENADATERSLARFQREVQLSARLNHPNTIEIYDFGRTEEGTFFYVMEYVDGISLEQLVDYYGRQPAERVIYLLLQICGSISEAHLLGMVHRDIKPANVLLTSRSGIHDLVKVLDFGLAKQLDHDSMQLTRVDSLTGTPLYMSPESIRDAASADPLSDLYSIGALGYTLLCGHAPFDGESSTDVCAKKLHEEPEAPEIRIGVPLAKDLQAVLLRCLSLDPAKRPPSAQHLAAELFACADSPHWTQADAALWWREIFDGPYLDDFELSDAQSSSDGTQGDTAVNEKRPAVKSSAQSTAN